MGDTEAIGGSDNADNPTVVGSGSTQAVEAKGLLLDDQGGAKHPPKWTREVLVAVPVAKPPDGKWYIKDTMPDSDNQRDDSAIHIERSWQCTALSVVTSLLFYVFVIFSIPAVALIIWVVIVRITQRNSSNAMNTTNSTDTPRNGGLV